MQESNKRIAKNTLYLYCRMVVIMILGFVTTRIVLDKLGASDYGINNLVAGFVASFSVLNSILSSSTRRFLALYIGKGSQSKLSITFSTSFVLHIIIACVIVLLLESFGLWFVNTDLNIAHDRMQAANWVFQFAVIGTFVSVLQTPFMAAVTAHENFKFYAIMSIYDVVAKLLVIFLLIAIPGDKLIVYAFLNLLVSFSTTIIYYIYCIKKFPECGRSLTIDKPLLKEMLKFSGWGAFGHVITIVNNQGVSIILNIFFNTVMNAARGLAMTVNFSIAQFITGFLTAAQPQLVKFYGAGEVHQFNRLIFNVSQYTLFLMAIISVPIFLEIDYVVNIWLGGNVPPYTCSFIKITLFCSIIGRSNSMVENGLAAIGRVKENNLFSVPVYILTLPLVYLVLWMGLSPIWAYWISSIPPLLSFIINLILLSKFTGFPGIVYFNNIFLKNIFLICLSAIGPFLVQMHMEEGLFRFIVICSISIISTLIVLWFLGLNKETKLMVKTKLLSRFN